jgi:hypothetical protein
MKFLADEMLGKLAKWLRILGYDTLYYNYIPDDELLSIALREQRLILTRDTRLIKRRLAKNYLLVRHDHWLDQLKQLVAELGLDTRGNLLARCCLCNQLLEVVEKTGVRAYVPPYVYQTQSCFKQCPCCRRIYWPATHVASIIKQIELIS